MNAAEGRQAAETFALHFSCRDHGIDDGRVYFVLAADDVLKGIVGLHQYSWGPPENVWLAWFAVEPQCRRHGLGALLMKAVIERAKQLGFMKLFVETYSTPEFADARAFYRAHGFQAAGNVRNYLPCGGDMVVFLKELTSHV
jgi:GNAT superfamily N-acetyltransferase